MPAREEICHFAFLFLIGFGFGGSSALWVYRDSDPALLDSPLAEQGSPPPWQIVDGMPQAPGPPPPWLALQDRLLLDARPPPGRRGDGGILVVLASVEDAAGIWGRDRERPPWLRACLAATLRHARANGHAVVLRTQPTEPQLTAWQVRDCGGKSSAQCRRENERENYNWEKHLMLSQYLESAENFSHVLMLDADATLVRPGADTLRAMAGRLEAAGRDLFLTDEDWLLHGEGRINGGLIFARNSNFSRHLFRDTFEAHVNGPKGLKKWRIGVDELTCASNEQICLDVLYRGSEGGKTHFAPRVIVSSGIRYNRGACVLYGCNEPVARPAEWRALGMRDPEMEVLHFMGSTKSRAVEALCEGKEDLVGDLREWACGSKM